MSSRILTKFIVVILVCLFVFGKAVQSEPVEHARHEDSTKKEEGFNPGKLIFEHIGDSYEWHIATVGELHISIPLLAIVYSSNKGLVFFPVSRFHHGQHEHEGFRIAKEGEKDAGKIVEQQADGTWKRPIIDLSITKNVLSIFISVILLIYIFLAVSKRYQERPLQAPTGLQNAVEVIILFVRDDVVKSSIGAKNYERFMPYLLTVFFFILINNLLGLVPFPPGGANITGNIAVTAVLAAITFIITSINGNKNYWMHIVNMPGVPWWLKFPVPLMPIVEIMGLFIKPFVLMVRLFANMTAGHIVALGFYSLIFIFGHMNVFAGYAVSPLSILFTVFMGLLELLVAFIQAYVFTFLSALYFGMATEEHHH